MMTVNQSGSQHSATVIPFPGGLNGMSPPVEELALVRDAVLQETAEVELLERVLMELRERLLIETLRLEAQCAQLRPAATRTASSD